MASDTDTARPDPIERSARPAGPRRRLPGFGGSKLGRLILALNMIGLLILVGGAFGVNEWRRGLVDARVDYLTAQAELVAAVLAEASATRGEPIPELDPIRAALVLREDYIPAGQRARLFDVTGQLIADSYTVSDAVTATPLPPARKRGEPAPPPPDPVAEARRLEAAQAALTAEVEAALDGEPQWGIRRSETGERVVSVSIPVRHVAAVIGVLTLEAGDFSEIVARQRWAMAPFAVVAFGVSVLSAILLHLFVVRPVLRLSAAADQVRLQRARAISLPDLEARDDEIGDLARSLETMTATLSARLDAIERFAADVAHEIKNPLTSIRSAVETLNLVDDPAAKARLTALLQQDVRRMDRLITDISNASRLDAELSRDAPHPVDLGRLLADIVEAENATAKAGSPALSLSNSATPRGATVTGREGALGQVFRNLIDNARSFSPPDGQVRLTLETEGALVRAVVEDDGPGIPPENLETVFERFYTSRPKGQAFGGNSGLGLSIVRQIVTAHGGRVSAANRTGEEGQVLGARFTVELPRLPS
ncbi:ATP-binding protein [Brevundimonas sp. 2R-24]|uniref:histidine kinase n=1 Tax=Peiella sedimenti TaxID=3061083 RepID=A0ABT8SNC3_9CAUL|nr:ATP-binding protein [Caulobacteraceae bacterium XZ-24]